MSETPTDCPGLSDLRTFRDGTAPEIDRRVVAAHVETCPVCRSQLDAWTQDAAARSGETRSHLSPATAPGATSNGLVLSDQASPGPGAPVEPSTDVPGSLPEGTLTDPDGTTVPGGDAIAGDGLAAPVHPRSARRLGHYALLEQIGKGGMGVVFKALDERLNRIVAVKVLAAGLADGVSARQRFIREARAAAAICHEHVVTIHAVDESAGQPYIVMQLVAGESLQEKLDRSGRLAVADIVRIGMQVALGLAAAHAQGVVHRDIKPANVLLESGAGRVKITDFGLARAVDDVSLTTSGILVGTPNFMSPEQARGEPVDRLTDLFSLGSMLYAMCTGEPPFRAETPVVVLRRVSDDVPRPIALLNPEVPEWLVGIIARLMQKAPGERYQSAALVAEVLAGHLTPPEQPSQPASGRTKSLSTTALGPKRFQRMAALSLTIGLAAVAIAVFSWWSFSPRTSRQVSGAPDSRSQATPSPPDPPPSGPLIAAKYVARDPVMSKTFYTMAEEAAKKREQKRALELYDESISRDPENTAALLARASLSSSYSIANWPGAIADTTDVIRREPKNADAYELRARARVRSNAYRAAIDDATEAIRLDPGRVEAFVVRGVAYNGLGEWSHALVDLDKVIKRTPDWSWNWFERATAYLGLNEHDRALADVNRAIALDRSINQFWYLRSRIHTAKDNETQAIADVTEGIRLSPEPERFHGYRRRGEVEVSFGKIDPAIADYTQAIRLRAKQLAQADSLLFTGRANLYMAHAENDLALADLDEAVRLDARNYWVLFHRGLARARKRKFDQAIADFEAGLKLARDDKLWAGILTHSRAEALILAGRTREGLAGLDDALAVDRDRRSHPVLASRAWLIDRPKGDYEAALQKLDETAKGGMIIQFLYRGLIYMRLEKPDRALDDFKEVIKRVKTRRDWFAIADYTTHWLAFSIGRGEAYLAKGDIDLALADAQEAVRFAPRSAEARLLRARIHEKRGQQQLAEADRQEASRLEPDDFITLPEPRGTAGAKHE